MNIFDNYSPMPECNKEYYSIWLENGSDNHGIQGRVQRGKAAPGAGLEGAPRVPKRSTKLLFYGIRLVCFSEKSLSFDVFGTYPFSITVAHVAASTLLVQINGLSIGVVVLLVTTLDCRPRVPGSSPEWVPIYYEAARSTAQG